MTLKVEDKDEDEMEDEDKDKEFTRYVAGNHRVTGGTSTWTDDDSIEMEDEGQQDLRALRGR